MYWRLAQEETRVAADVAELRARHEVVAQEEWKRRRQAIRVNRSQPLIEWRRDGVVVWRTRGGVEFSLADDEEDYTSDEPEEEKEDEDNGEESDESDENRRRPCLRY